MKNLIKGQTQDLHLQETKKAFTLVELIIVITILAILATIAFVSFQNYNKSARDSNRVSSITQINIGLETFYVKTGSVPMVDNQIGTGTLSGNAVTYVGYIGDTVSKHIQINKTPIDPATNTNYIYAVDTSRNKYQIASIVEDLQINKGNLITQTYADGGLKARVLGNYMGLLKYSGKIYNIPSLIITFSGSTSQDLLATTTNYVIDKADNLPYLAWSAKQLNTFTPTQVLQKQTNTGATLIVTGITLPTDASTWNTNSGTLQTSFGYNIDVIGQTIFGNDYFSNIKGNTNASGGGGGGSSTCTVGQGFNGTSCVTATSCTTGLESLTLTGQTWSCKNLGATTVRNGSTQPTLCGFNSNTNCNLGLTWLGDYYQWGRNEPVNTTTTITTYNGTFSGTLGHNNFVLGQGTYWDWWQNEAGNASPTRWTGTTPQGPCPTNWHVPTQADWQNLCNLVTGTICANGMGYNSAISQVLKLPFAGARDGATGYYKYQSQNGYYWSSSPSTAAYRFGFDTANIYPVYAEGRANGFNVRCIKN